MLGFASVSLQAVSNTLETTCNCSDFLDWGNGEEATLGYNRHRLAAKTLRGAPLKVFVLPPLIKLVAVCEDFVLVNVRYGATCHAVGNRD